MNLFKILHTNKLLVIILITEILFSVSTVDAQNCPTTIDYGKNIVCNGDFELGDYCFSTNYIPFSKSPVTYSTPNYYLLGGNPSFFNTAFSGSNHTAGGNNFLMIDGSCTPNQIVWKQTVTILPNTNYFFSAWISTLMSTAPAQLQFSINGVVIGTPFNAPGNTNVWTSFTQLWNSGSLNGSIVIEIINLTTAGCNNGNDFGIDDISFIPGCAYGTPGPQPNLGPDVYLCTGDSVELNAGLKSPYTNLNISWNTGSSKTKITVKAPGKYSICVDSAGSCVRSDVIEIIAGDQIKAAIIVDPISGCSPLTVNIKSTTKGYPLNYKWYINGQLTTYSSEVLPPQVFTNSGTTSKIHTVKLAVTNICGNSDSITSTITVLPSPKPNLQNEVNICKGESIQLNASVPGGTSYIWTAQNPNNFLSCDKCPDPIVKADYSIVFYVTITDNNGCTAKDTVKINVLYNLDVKMNDTTICAGTSFTLKTNIDNATSYNWSPSSGLSCVNCSSPVASPTITTTYNVQVTKASCSGNGTVTINVKNCGPSVVITGTTICRDACADLTAQVTFGQPPFTFTWSNGSTGAGPINVCPSTTTTYTVSITDNTGQSSIDTAIVKVLIPPSVTVTNPFVCQGNTAIITAQGAYTYVWSASGGQTGASINVTPAATTTYTVTGTDLNGCSNTAEAKVTVHPLPVISINVPVICKDSTAILTASGATNYKWSTGDITSTIIITPTSFTPLNYTVTGTDVNGCSNTSMVNIIPQDCSEPSVTINGKNICTGTCTSIIANATGTPPLTFTWNPNIGSGAGPYNICLSVTTTYTITVTDAKGVTVKDTAVVTVNPVPSVTVNSTTVCAGETATLTAGGAQIYTWSDNSTASAITVNPIVTTSYTVTGTSNGCSNTAIATVTVNPLPSITTGPDVSICQGLATTLTANGASNYTWAPANGLSSGTGSTVIANPITTTTYTVTGYFITGCSASATVVVTVNSNPSINIPAVTVCQGGSALLIASGANSYTWSPAIGLNTTTGNPVIAKPSGTTTYTVIGKSSGGCTSVTTVVVTVNLAPTITSTPTNICPGEDTILTAIGAVSYTWSPASTLSSSTGSKVTARPLKTTTYTITGTGTNGCTSSTTVSVTVHPDPVAAFTTIPSDISTIDPTVHFIDLSKGAVSWNWSLGNPDKTISTLQNPVLKYPDLVDKYNVTLVVTSQYGCIDTVRGTVYIRGIFTFYVPNAFTPNGDGMNDLFMPKGNGIDETDYELLIFDRWGNLIWHTLIWGEAWNGKANNGGDVAQIDTYVWKVHLREKDSGKRHNYIGHVNILK